MQRAEWLVSQESSWFRLIPTWEQQQLVDKMILHIDQYMGQKENNFYNENPSIGHLDINLAAGYYYSLTLYLFYRQIL